MKTTFSTFALLASAAVLSVSCNKEADNTQDTILKHVVEFTAETADSRTAFGEKNGENAYPTLWTAEDKVHVWSDTDYSASSADVTPSADGRTARFSATLTAPEAGQTACYNAITTNKGRLYSRSKEYDIAIPAAQTPTAASCDSAAQFAFATSGEVGAEATNISLHFTHITAYGKFSIKNLAADAGAVSSVSVSAESPLAGSFEVYYKESPMRLKAGRSAVSKITIATSSLDDIWFACAPADLSGTTLEIKVSAEGGDYTKKIDLTGKTLKFEAGKVSEFAVDMAGITPPKSAGKFTIGSESVSCFGSVVEYEFGRWSKSMTIYIADNEGTTKSQMTSGSYLSISFDLSTIADLADFSFENVSITYQTSSYGSAYYNNGKASVAMTDGNLKFTITDAKMPEGWSYDPTLPFSVSYDGPCTSICSASSFNTYINSSSKYNSSITTMFAAETAERTIFMAGSEGSPATAAAIADCPYGVKITVPAAEQGKILDVATSQAKTEFYDYAAKTTRTALSGNISYYKLSDGIAFIYARVFLDADEKDYVEVNIACKPVATTDTDIAPKAE